MAEMITCPKCGKATPDARFCKHCGEPLHTCQSCGAKISSDAKFCIECGMELPEEVISAALEVNPKAYARYGPSLIPQHILLSGEVPLFETRPVLWLQLMPPVVFTMLGLAILASVYLRFHYQEILYGCGVVFLLGVVWAFTGWFRWRYIIYAATNRRVLRQTGIVSKSYVDCPLNSVQAIHLDISIWGRINGFGTVRITGGGTQIEWENVDEPKEAHRLLNEIVEQYRQQAFQARSMR